MKQTATVRFSADRNGVPQHDVTAALEAEWKGGNCVVTGSVPAHMGKEFRTLGFTGRGKSFSLAVLDWLAGLCGSIGYAPAYMREHPGTMARLHSSTYVVEHNPNCPSPFRIRLIPPGGGKLDHKPVQKTKDILGHGHTLEEAAAEAFERYDAVAYLQLFGYAD